MSTPDTQPEKPMLYKVDSLAEEFDCSPSTIWNLIGTGELKSIKIGKSRRITRAEAERYIADKAGAGA